MHQLPVCHKVKNERSEKDKDKDKKKSKNDLQP